MKYYVQLIAVGTYTVTAINVGGTEFDKIIKKEKFLYDKWRANETIKSFKYETISDKKFPDSLSTLFEVKEKNNISRHLKDTQGIHKGKVSKKSKSQVTKKNRKSSKKFDNLKTLYKSQLDACLAREATKESTIEWLWVQMSDTCTFEREKQNDESFIYSVNLVDVHPETYGFGDRPSREIYTMASWIFTETFNLNFGTEKPNGAITFSTLDYADGEIVGTFESPMIGVFVEPYNYITGNHTQFSYKMKQSKNQENGFELSSLFEGNSNLSRNYDKCSFFIDDVDLKEANGISSVLMDSYNKLTKLDITKETITKLQIATKFSPLGKTSVMSATALVNSISKLNDAIASGETSDILGSVGGMLMAAGGVTAIFGPVAVVVEVVGIALSLLSNFFGSAPTTATVHTITLGDLTNMVETITNAFENIEETAMYASLKTIGEDYDIYTTRAMQTLQVLSTTTQARRKDRLIKQYHVDFTNLISINTQMERMKDISNNVFITGPNNGYLRSTHLKWMTDLNNMKCCRDEKNPQFDDLIHLDDNHLSTCNSMMRKGKPFDQLIEFASMYINAAYKMYYFIVISRSIMCQDSKCNCDKGESDNVNIKCDKEYKTLIYSTLSLVYDQVFQQASTLKASLYPPDEKSISPLETACDYKSFKYPINQKCNSNLFNGNNNVSCNYRYNLVASCGRFWWNGDDAGPDGAQANGIWQFSSWDSSTWSFQQPVDCSNHCQDDWNGLNKDGTGAFWDNIVHGYYSNAYFETHSWEHGSCSDMCNLADDDASTYGGDICIIGVPNLCAPNTCEDFFKNDANFGV